MQIVTRSRGRYPVAANKTIYKIYLCAALHRVELSDRFYETASFIFYENGNKGERGGKRGGQDEEKGGEGRR